MKACTVTGCCSLWPKAERWQRVHVAKKHYRCSCGWVGVSPSGHLRYVNAGDLHSTTPIVPLMSGREIPAEGVRTAAAQSPYEHGRRADGR